MTTKINATTGAAGGLSTSADSSGVIELQSNGVTKFTISPQGSYGNIRLESVKVASGTAVDFTGIPSWTKRITVLFNGVGTNGSSQIIIQLGSTGGVESTGYSGSGNSFTGAGSTSTLFTNGMGTSSDGVASAVRHASANIILVDGNTWNMSYNGSRSDAARFDSGSASKTLASTLDRIRITTTSGTDVFDSGLINILIEG